MTPIEAPSRKKLVSLKSLPACFLALMFAMPLSAQDMSATIIRDGDRGVMTMVMPGSKTDASLAVVEQLTFEPWEMLGALSRDDVVMLMRHGPTDWSKRDVSNVAPTDCANQRTMTNDGKRQMYELGALLVANDLRPGRIIVSDWCRNQETLEAMRAGMADARTNALDDLEVQTMSELNLLLSLQGAPDVAAMRDMIAAWDGGTGEGPLLVISHFTNIQELTEQAVFEGQILVLDPKDGSRVQGLLRLKSAAPDVGHFK